jgi:hypothetical protein
MKTTGKPWDTASCPARAISATALRSDEPCRRPSAAWWVFSCSSGRGARLQVLTERADEVVVHSIIDERPRAPPRRR